MLPGGRQRMCLGLGHETWHVDMARGSLTLSLSLTCLSIMSLYERMAPLGSSLSTSCTKSWYACSKGARRGEEVMHGAASRRAVRACSMRTQEGAGALRSGGGR